MKKRCTNKVIIFRNFYFIAIGQISPAIHEDVFLLLHLVSPVTQHMVDYSLFFFLIAWVSQCCNISSEQFLVIVLDVLSNQRRRGSDALGKTKEPTTSASATFTLHGYFFVYNTTAHWNLPFVHMYYSFHSSP